MPTFGDRIDLKQGLMPIWAVGFSIGNNVDIYPGLDLGSRILGVTFRY